MTAAQTCVFVVRSLTDAQRKLGDSRRRWKQKPGRPWRSSAALTENARLHRLSAMVSASHDKTNALTIVKEKNTVHKFCYSQKNVLFAVKMSANSHFCGNTEASL